MASTMRAGERCAVSLQPRFSRPFTAAYCGVKAVLDQRPNMSSNTHTGPSAPIALAPGLVRYNRFLLIVAGLGGLLYGIDVGIIGGALPYLEATSHLNPAELSIMVAAVLLGSVFSTLFAGLLADWMGRKPLMILAGVAFTLSIPVIALSQSYSSLFAGRLLQGMSGGIVGVVVPLYLAECLSAGTRGKRHRHLPVAAHPRHLCRGPHRRLLQLSRCRN